LDGTLSTFQPDADHFVVEYDNFMRADTIDPDDRVTFQIVLDRTGQVQLNYKQVPQHTPADLTIGVSVDDGRFYNQITCRVAGTTRIGEAPNAGQSIILHNEELY